MSALDTRQGGPDDNDAQAGHLVYGIHADAWSRSGEAETLSPDAQGRMRLRPPGLGVYEDQSPSLTASLPHAVAYRKTRRAASSDDAEAWIEDEIANTMNGFDQGDVRTTELVAAPLSAVRRLTPLECERLQGFPDGWTEGESDSTRYRMLGNAVCVPVAEWIGRRMMTQDIKRASDE